ncbi:MBL fold metallo-hydrolase [Asanoa ishikariensis]|uniref:Glyoxylase, beta-lactamase superfamily II n=1 Tax=Asanoa ishikariensis TaxID=137265 RepID=A0A1H3UVL9_9ACTN|nr:MBL fold metallo-hydrolase [Asanoa ishikariensis]GIF65165.1 MBL fold metallo-hydrolase [Asanoa ishikariensis]SDZ66472.1 Glyoxylase, beta-lactamase superfamily II [Asanoa ishikariensis]
MTAHVTTPAAALAERLPEWTTLVRAPNPGPMTLDGTNTWVLRATPGAPAVVVDPGPLDEGHLRAVAEHGPIGTVLATHGHPDHVEGLERFAQLTGAKVLRDLGEHELAGVAITALPTPGHTADSVCFVAAAGGERAVFTGDTILGRGTTVVAHPDGDLGAYLASLELLTAYPGQLALPGHGPALADCAVAARFYLAHRRARLDQVRQAVANGAKTADEVVSTVYADVDPSLWPAAAWSVRAQLAYLGVPSGESRRGSQGLDGP